MSAFTFETITPEQAAAFAGADTLAFTGDFANFSNISVVVSGANVTFGFLGRQVTFGAGFTGQVRTVPIANGSTFVIGTSASETFTGTSKTEAIYAGDGADTLVAGAGDRLAGGAGADLFAFATGVNGAAILDFGAGDRIAVSTVTPTLLDYVEEQLGDSSTATNFATSRIASGALNFVVVGITATTLAVFVDSLGDNTVGVRFTIENSSLGAIDHLSFIAAPAGVLPAPPPPPPATGDAVNGTDASETLSGGVGNDTVQGLGGDDVLIGRAGNDRLDGGAGSDTVSYAEAGAAVTVSLVSGAGSGAGQGADVLISIEGVFGSGFNDTLSGSTSADTLRGGAGGDIVFGGGGGDFVYGETGDDTLTGNPGALMVDGGDGNDMLSAPGAQSAALTLTGGAGNDVLTAGGGTLFGDAGNDTLTVTGVVSGLRLDGGAGADVLTGGALADTLAGGSGDDTITGGQGRDEITTGDGADRIEIASGEFGVTLESADMILDWSALDRLVFGGGLVVGGAYAEFSANDPIQAATQASQAMAAGSNFVAVQLGSDVLVFVDSANTNVAADGVRLVGRTLADLDAANFIAVSAPPLQAPAPPPFPAPSTVLIPGLVGTLSGDMDGVHLNAVLGAPFDGSEFQLNLAGAGGTFQLRGTNFSYDGNDQLAGGSVTSITMSIGGFAATLQSRGISATPFVRWVINDATQEAFSTLLSTQDFLGGSAGADLMRGYAGDDILYGAGGQDTVYGGLGDDIIFAIFPQGISGTAGVGGTYLRGDEGNDYILGGPSFDDINGNMGNDTVIGGAGTDWVVGGKDNDLIFGDAGADLVYGNLGADTLEAGDGDDIVRGGQDNDIVRGAAGADFVSGDKGDDTMTGGDGADIFHTFGDAGIDRVTDFSLTQGDRVQLDPGTQYTVSQVGPDTVINMTGGGQMVLLGVTLSSLTPGWIFGA